MIGTIFPLLSSTVSVTTFDGGDDTYWLTYWSCFGCLFMVTDFLENFLGNFPGFYTFVIAITVYLMLPLFRGADQVFRGILVPFAGLEEELLRRDAEELKRVALATLSPERKKLLMKSIAASFQEGSKEA